MAITGKGIHGDHMGSHEFTWRSQGRGFMEITWDHMRSHAYYIHHRLRQFGIKEDAKWHSMEIKISHQLQNL